jgi:hypothetical protein
MWRARRPRRRPIWGNKKARRRCRRGLQTFCDDVIMPVICPTSQTRREWGERPWLSVALQSRSGSRFSGVIGQRVKFVANVMIKFRKTTTALLL